jgi:hypothetical protein
LFSSQIAVIWVKSAIFSPNILANCFFGHRSEVGLGERGCLNDGSLVLSAQQKFSSTGHNFRRFLTIFGEKIGVFLQNQCYDQNFALSSFV